VCLTQDGSGEVHGTVYGDALVEEVSPQTARILSLDVDGSGWPAVGDGDPAVGRLQRMFPGFRPVNWSNAYEAAAWCLISSRIAMRQAQGIKDRMCRELGAEVDVHGHHLWCFPGPEALIQLTVYRRLFGRKVEYLNALGHAAMRGDLDTETLRGLPQVEALEQLKRLKGIGEFGSQLIRLRALSAVDELPTAEPRLLQAVREAYGLTHDPDITELASDRRDVATVPDVGGGQPAADAGRRRRHDALARVWVNLSDSRVLRPQQHWQVLDFALAAIALASLGFALVGLSNVAGALNDTRALQKDCPATECDHHGTVSGSSTYGSQRFAPGSTFCIITMDLDIGQRQAALAGTVCRQIPPGSPIDATIWRGSVVVVKTAIGTMGTANNPGGGVGVGLFRMLAILPALLLVAMIHVDIANHRVVRRIRGRLLAS